MALIWAGRWAETAAWKPAIARAGLSFFSPGLTFGGKGLGSNGQQWSVPGVPADRAPEVRELDRWCEVDEYDDQPQAEPKDYR